MNHSLAALRPKQLSDRLAALEAHTWVRALVALLAFVLIAATAGWVVHEIQVRRDWPAYTDMDLYLDAADELAHGRSPYDDPDQGLHRYPYPPLFADLIAVLVAVFGAFAPYVWIVATGFFLVASLWLVGRRFGFRLPAYLILFGAGILMIGRTARIDLMHGQLNFMLLLLLVLGLMAWRGKRTWLAGAFWAFAICCKPFLGVIVFFLARQRDWKGAAITFGLSGVIFWASFLPTFPHVLETFESWRETTRHYASVEYAANPLNQSFYALGLRLFTDNDFSTPWLVAPALSVAFLGLAVLSALTIFWIVSAPRPDDGEEAGAFDLLRFGSALAVLMSLGPVTEGDHIFFVVPAAIAAFVLTWRRVRADAQCQWVWLAASAAWLIMLLILAWPRQLLLYFGEEETWVYLRGAGILLSGANAFLLFTPAALTAVAFMHERKAAAASLAGPELRASSA